MVHAKDIFDLLCEDTPELWGRILTGVSIEEMNENRMGRTVVQENHKFRHEIKALRSEANREVPVLSKWADGLDRFMTEIYGDWAARIPSCGTTPLESVVLEAVMFCLFSPHGCPTPRQPG